MGEPGDARSFHKGTYSSWLTKVKQDGAKAKWLANSLKRYFTIDFNTQTFYYSHSQDLSEQCHPIAFREIVKAQLCPRTDNGPGGNDFGFVVRTRDKYLELYTNTYSDAQKWVEGLNAGASIAQGRQKATPDVEARVERPRIQTEQDAQDDESRWYNWANGTALASHLQPLLAAENPIGKIEFDQSMRQTGLWIALWALVAPAVCICLGFLVNANDAEFPHPLLGVALAGFGATLICWLVLIIRGEASEAADLLFGNKELQLQVGIIGLLLGVEVGIAALMFMGAMSVEVTVHMLTPVLTLFVVTFAYGRRWPPVVPLIATCLAAAAGMLTDLQRPSYEWLLQAPFAVVGDILITFRWVLLQFLLQPDSRTNRPPPPTQSPLIFAAGLLPTGAMVCLEATVLFERDGLVALLHLQHLREVALLIVALACGCFLLILSEIQIVQRTSATTMSMLLPISHIGMSVAVAMWSQTLPATCLVGGCVCAVAVMLYVNETLVAPTEEAKPNGGSMPRRSNSSTHTPIFPSSLAGWGLSRAGPAVDEPMKRQSSWRQNLPTGPGAGVAPLYMPPPAGTTRSGVAPLGGLSDSLRNWRGSPKGANKNVGVGALGPTPPSSVPSNV